MHDHSYRRSGNAGGMAFTAGPQQGGEAQTNVYRRGFKRALDLFLILLSLPIVLPVVGLMALLVALDGGKPFYSQDRIGRGGKIYRIWKLRTMVHDADARLDSYLRENPVLREQWLTKQKLLDDPRITRLGRILRKTSLDELPQLFNVFKGDMSLVGPRPMMVSQKEMYPGQAYYRLRPGITGLWQVSDRNETRFSERAWYDEEYDRNLSFMGDVSILLATVRVVLRGTGH
ncbi:MAG: sugar transferase [Paracoccus sp. (in: a-proteobacteria)]|nr:sugar transferase [Paracoccus sp. (in: a-proteobacteria)]